MSIFEQSFFLGSLAQNFHEISSFPFGSMDAPQYLGSLKIFRGLSVDNGTNLNTRGNTPFRPNQGIFFLPFLYSSST